MLDHEGILNNAIFQCDLIWGKFAPSCKQYNLISRGSRHQVLWVQEAYSILNDPDKRREFDLGETSPSRGVFEVWSLHGSEHSNLNWWKRACKSSVIFYTETRSMLCRSREVVHQDHNGRYLMALSSVRCMQLVFFLIQQELLLISDEVMAFWPDNTVSGNWPHHVQGHWTSWFGEPIASSTPLLDRRQFMGQVLQDGAAWIVQVGIYFACKGCGGALYILNSQIFSSAPQSMLFNSEWPESIHHANAGI